MFAAGVVFTRLNVAATSAGVKADPSLHLTPVRIVKVRVLPPLDHAYVVASHGYDVPALSVSNSNSGSYTSERTLICVANEFESNGLKLSVKVTPVLPSNVTKWALAPDAALRPALMTMPSVKHDIAVKTTASFSKHIFPLY